MGLLRSISPFGAELRTPLFAGFLGSVPASVGETRSPYPCRVAVAHHPRRLLHPHDDASVASAEADPYSAVLEGIPGRMPSDHLLFPLVGLMVSRYPREDAVRSTPERQELLLHRDTVVKEVFASNVASRSHGSLLPSPVAPLERQFQGNGSHLHWVVRLIPPWLPPIRTMPRAGDEQKRPPDPQPCRGDSAPAAGASHREGRRARRWATKRAAVPVAPPKRDPAPDSSPR
jgi:hypothetical protein